MSGVVVKLDGYLELPGRDMFVYVEAASSHDWQQAAVLARARLPRCKPGSAKWLRYAATVQYAQSKMRRGLTVLPGGAS